jgi:precorrin-2 dehydrogenase/sirohydrochlorin ferrochelatase
MRYYPIFLKLRGRRCVVAGGGKVAEWKVLTLLRAGAEVRVISPEVTPRLAALAKKRRISLTPRAYRKGDLDARAQGLAPRLVFAATNDAETQRAVREEAKAVGALVNVVDDRDHSTFLVPASFAQGDLQVAISTSGASPALARRLRQQLQTTLGRDYETYLRLLREARKQILKSVPTQAQRARAFRRLADALVTDWFDAAKPHRARKGIGRLLRELGGKSRS